MPDNLAIINRVIQEHQRIRSGIQAVGQSMNDMEAVFSLQQAYAGWTTSSIEATLERQKHLQKVMELLEIGLNNHFAFEENALPPLLGEMLMQALIIEHKEIRRQIAQAKVMLNTKLTDLPQEALLQQKLQIQQAINVMSQTSEEHAAREEIILNMMKKVLEKE
ncbi:MAG: hemerythrin domain-containing protein [Dehalococcoidales bacterium]|nr:hemerythrin domain-containing protein [Dehalococcoidales bacterium]